MHRGDAISNIYYLFNGSMEVLQDGMVVAILGKFWFFKDNILRSIYRKGRKYKNRQVHLRFYFFIVIAIRYCTFFVTNIFR